MCAGPFSLRLTDVQGDCGYRSENLLAKAAEHR